MLAGQLLIKSFEAESDHQTRVIMLESLARLRPPGVAGNLLAVHRSERYAPAVRSTALRLAVQSGSAPALERAIE